MSRFSGKCDLYDHIMMKHLRTKDGSDKKEDLEKVGAYYSDELECFNEFKARTGGVIYQHLKVEVTEYNQKVVAEKCPNLEIIEHKEIIFDKRVKSGQKEKITYTYKYWDKEYTLKELNKHGVYVTVDIHFNTLLDIIPYYPYIVCVCVSNNDKETVVISKESHVISERDGHYKNGYFSDFWEYYTKELQDHYREVVLRYFNPEGYAFVKEVEFEPVENKDGKIVYIGLINEAIDTNFDLEWRWEDGEIHNHWTSPKLLDSKVGLVEMSKADYESYIGPKASIYFVIQRKQKLYLD